MRRFIKFWKKRKRLDSRGDTIIEIMIVLSIIGMALGISYATANTSLLGVREAQEHSEAYELMQQQLEYIYQLAPNNSPTDPNLTNETTSNIFAPTTPYCIHSLADSPVLTSYDSSDNNCSFGGNGLYNYTILVYNCDQDTTSPRGGPVNPCTQITTPLAGTDTFIVTSTWPSLSGGNDTANLTYRVHQVT